jgi:hypothetical protein
VVSSCLGLFNKKKSHKKGATYIPCERSISGSFPPRGKTFHAKNKHFLALEEEDSSSVAPRTGKYIEEGR